MITKNIFLVLLLLLKFTFNQNGIITFSFKKESPNLNNVDQNDIIPKKLINNLIMVELRVGTNPQLLKLKLEFDTCVFYIASESSSNEIKFKEKQSTTYRQMDKNIIPIDKSNLNKAILSSDYIYLNKDSNNKYNITFLLGIDTDKDISGGLIGLNLDEEKVNKYNFLNELKRLGLINDYHFTIKYIDNNSGNLIIGNLPHIYDSNRFKKNNYKEIYADFTKDDLTWKIKFNEIYIGDKKESNEIKIEDYAYCYLRLEKAIIEGSEKYRQYLLNTFMKEQINNNLCFEVDSEYHYSYYCKKEADISKLKNIYFYNKKLEFTFELTYKDLFYYNDNDKSYYFLIIFSNDLEEDDEYNKYWVLGEPIFKKYQFVFNKDSKTIGIYTSINNINDGDSWWAKNKWYFILIMLLIILLIGLGAVIFYFLKFIPRKRKIKANELDDDFDYNSNTNKLTNENE